jgi:hypothetical protein
MEILLNSVWALVVTAIVCLWVRFGERTNGDRRTPFVAMAMLIVILFPVISVSDDLWSIQNPAETDTCQRRCLLGSYPHCTHPAFSAHPEPVFTGLRIVFLRLNIQVRPPLFVVDTHIMDGIENRPPPGAARSL